MYIIIAGSNAFTHCLRTETYLAPITVVQDDELQDRAKNNSIDNFTFRFEDRFMDFLIDRIAEKNFFQKMMENEDQRAFLMNEMKEEVYYRLREH